MAQTASAECGAQPPHSSSLGSNSESAPAARQARSPPKYGLCCRRGGRAQRPPQCAKLVLRTQPQRITLVHTYLALETLVVRIAVHGILGRLALATATPSDKPLKTQVTSHFSRSSAFSRTLFSSAMCGSKTSASVGCVILACTRATVATAESARHHCTKCESTPTTEDRGRTRH